LEGSQQSKAQGQYWNCLHGYNFYHEDLFQGSEMNDFYLTLGFLALLAIQFFMGEIDKRRSIRREDCLLKMVKSLQNRISAKDLGAYIQLENHELQLSRPEVPQQRSISREDLFDAMNYGEHGAT
jgi:hypothetical protein